MFDKIKRIVILIFLTGTLLLGLLEIYRATLKTTDLTVISGKVVDKKILYYTSGNTGRHYCLAFKLANRQDKVSINLGTKSQAYSDSAFYLIDTGKVYTFYVDPTVPTQNGINWGIDKIAYNNNEIYKTSNKLNLYGGTLISLLSLVGIIAGLIFRKSSGS